MKDLESRGADFGTLFPHDWLAVAVAELPYLPFLHKSYKIREGRSWGHKGYAVAGLYWGKGLLWGEAVVERWGAFCLSYLVDMLVWVRTPSEAGLYPCFPLETVLLRGQTKGTLLPSKEIEFQKGLLGHPKSFSIPSLTMATLGLYIQLRKHHLGLGKVQEKSKGMTNGWDCWIDRTL